MIGHSDGLLDSLALININRFNFSGSACCKLFPPGNADVVETLLVIRSANVIRSEKPRNKYLFFITFTFLPNQILIKQY